MITCGRQHQSLITTVLQHEPAYTCRALAPGTCKLLYDAKRLRSQRQSRARISHVGGSHRILKQSYRR